MTTPANEATLDTLVASLVAADPNGERYGYRPGRPNEFYGALADHIYATLDEYVDEPTYRDCINMVVRAAQDDMIAKFKSWASANCKCGRSLAECQASIDEALKP
jgi:hypothetical protein